MAMPATGALTGTPASISDSDDAHTDAIDVEPLEESTSETSRSAYGNSSAEGTTGSSARSARRPCPNALLDDPLADDLLGERPNGRLDLRLPSLEDRPQLEDGVGRRLVGRGVALGLVDDALGLGQRLTRHRADPLEDVLAVVGLGLVGHGLPGPDLLHQLTLEVDRLA